MGRITLVAAAIIPLILFAGGTVGCSPPPVESVPLYDEVLDDQLSAPVDVVRDQNGIPHIYGANLADAAFAQGYTMASDRLVQMDLARRQATGTLAELAGELSASVIDTDIRFRVHHMKRTADETLAAMRASADPDDAIIVEILQRYADGVNAYAKDLQDNRYSLPPALAFVYNPQTFRPWEPADTLAIGILATFNLSYDPDAEIRRSAVEATALLQFDMGGDPSRTGRRGIGKDMTSIEPVDRTYTLPGGTSAIPPALGPSSIGQLALYRAAIQETAAIGQNRLHGVAAGSNNWVVGPSLSATGRVMVASDPHLGISNPATFYLNHLVARGGNQPLDVQGAQFPGAPGVILGFNRHVAWGATVSALDVTDVYEETIVPCGAQPCVMFNGQMVPVVPRVETIKVGRFGEILRQVQVTLYDVPHHGPIIPRIGANHALEPLSSKELSVRWTGHDPAFLLKAVLGLNRAATVAEAADALVKHFAVGGQNWVLGDDQGHFGWTQAVRVPKRPAGSIPWKVLPGDGSAEWQGNVDQRWIPHAFDVASGFLATANADPIGITDDGDPWESTPDGPLYLGADYDPGTRVGRIVKRITEIGKTRKLTADDMQSIQGDVVSEWIELLAPTMKDAARALAEEIAQPGAHTDVSAMVAVASPASKAIVPRVVDEMGKWDFSLDEDSVAATLGSVWVNRFALEALEDELDIIGRGIGDDQTLKLLVRACTEPQKLASGPSSAGDPILFDNMNTPAVETKRQIAAKAILDMLDYLIPTLGADPGTWKWSRIHTLTLRGLLPIDALQIPLKTDSVFPNGLPRHGGNGTVDVAHHGLSVDDYTYGSGANLRAVYTLDPDGPIVKNAIPGGVTFDPLSPHYRDLLELWRKNRTYDAVSREPDVVESAKAEIAVNGGGRVRFRPR
jgi:penicillin G amidase